MIRWRPAPRWHPAGHRPAADRGGATVLVVAFTGLVVLIGAALGVVTAMVTDSRAAQSAADLAALAGASALGRGDDACGAAAEIAHANGAAVVDCRPDGWEVVVIVEVAGPRWLGQTGDLRARARAGPASEP